MAQTWDGAGTVRQEQRKPGEIGPAHLRPFYLVDEDERRLAIVHDTKLTCKPWIDKFVYFRGCVEKDQDPPVVRPTYCGDDPATRDATPGC